MTVAWYGRFLGDRAPATWKFAYVWDDERHECS